MESFPVGVFFLLKNRFLAIQNAVWNYWLLAAATFVAPGRWYLQDFSAKHLRLLAAKMAMTCPWLQWLSRKRCGWMRLAVRLAVLRPLVTSSMAPCWRTRLRMKVLWLLSTLAPKILADHMAVTNIYESSVAPGCETFCFVYLSTWLNSFHEVFGHREAPALGLQQCAGLGWCGVHWLWDTARKWQKKEIVFSDKLLVYTRGVFHLWTLVTLASSQRTLRPWGWLIAARCLPSSIHIQKWPGWERLRRCSSRKVRDESSIKFLSRFVLGKSTAVVLWRHGGPGLWICMYVMLLRMYATELGLSSTPKTNQNEEADHQEKAHQPNKRQRRRSRPPERPARPARPVARCGVPKRQIRLRRQRPFHRQYGHGWLREGPRGICGPWRPVDGPEHDLAHDASSRIW